MSLLIQQISNNLHKQLIYYLYFIPFHGQGMIDGIQTQHHHHAHIFHVYESVINICRPGLSYVKHVLSPAHRAFSLKTLASTRIRFNSHVAKEDNI